MRWPCKCEVVPCTCRPQFASPLPQPRECATCGGRIGGGPVSTAEIVQWCTCSDPRYDDAVAGVTKALADWNADNIVRRQNEALRAENERLSALFDKAVADEVAAVARVEDLEEEVGLFREALLPFAGLELPTRPEGNAAFYSIYLKHIKAARAALSEQEGSK